MRIQTLKLAIIAGTAITAVASTSAVQAKGCNGYVNQLEWGCAPWDNNNGPKFPHYKGPVQAQGPAVVAAGAKATVKDASKLGPGQMTAGGRIVAQGGGN